MKTCNNCGTPESEYYHAPIMSGGKSYCSSECAMEAYAHKFDLTDMDKDCLGITQR